MKKQFRKFSLLAILLSTAFFAQAQWKKGSVLFGVGLDNKFEIGSGSAKLTNSLGTLDIGYFVKDNWAMGVGLNMRNIQTEERIQLNYNLDMFTRYYLPYSKRVSFYGGAFAGFGQRKYNYRDLFLSNNLFNANFGAGGGMNVKLSKSINLDVGVRFTGNRFLNLTSNTGRLSLRTGLKFNLY